MILYVANCSKQIQDFQYWLPETPRAHAQIIGIGQQIKIAGSTDVLEGIIEQHRKYGIVNIKEVNRSKEFFGTAYSFDKPIDVDSIMNAIDRNDQAMEDAALESRKAAAVSMNNQLEATVQSMGGRMGHSEVEIVEQSKGPTDTAPKMQQTISVEQEQPAPHRGRGRPRKAA